METKDKHHPNTKKGHSLVEAAVAITIVSLLSVGAMSLVQHNLSKQQTETTEDHMKKIQEALQNQAERFGYLPCPADPTANLGDSGFGVATTYNTSSKTCDDASLVHGAGAVPVRALHLQDEVMYDGWGNKFTYRISDYAGAKVDLEENTAFQSSIRVANLDGVPLTHGFDGRNNGIVYILISHGAKSKGTTLNRGATTVDTDNIQMDKMSARATIGNANHADALYYRGTGKGEFDDVVVYGRRNQFFRPKQKIAEFAMEQDLCQNANIVLRSGAPRDEGTPLHQFAANNAGLESMSNIIYDAANRMKTICDASPIEALASVGAPPANLKTWGRNIYGQLGLGDTTNRYNPTEVGTDRNWAKINASYDYSLAIKTNGSLYSWGRNLNGQLGLGDTSERHSPTQVGIDTDWAMISSIGDHNLALKTNGSLYSWGRNTYGQLGLGDTAERHTPTQVGTDIDWETISAGREHSLALKTSGSLYAWGWNLYGKLGLGDTTDRNTPTQVGTDTDWDAISAGGYHSFALKTNGRLYSCGYNPKGQLGVGDTNTRDTLTQVGTDADWAAIDGGYYYSIGLKTNGSLYAWGDGMNGTLGLGVSSGNRNIPTQVGTDTDWHIISAGSESNFAIKTDGSLYAWGRNNYGQLGLGDAIDRYTPTQVGTDTDWTSASTGRFHSIAIK